MKHTSYSVFLSVSRKCWAVLLCSILLQGCNTNDLSDLNDLAAANLQATSYIVQFEQDLSAEQVPASSPVTSNNEATASFHFDIANNTVEGEVNIHKQNSVVLAVQICRGYAGKNGDVIAELYPSETPGIWQLSDVLQLSDGDAELLLQGALYAQIITTNHLKGDLRVQLIIGYQELMINPLTQEQVVDGNTSNVPAGTSYITVDYLSGDIQGALWLSDDMESSKVELRQGLAGTNGEVILTYAPDTSETGLWNILPNTRLPPQTVEAITSARTYLEVSSKESSLALLRGQVYPWNYYVDVVQLSGMNLVPEITTEAMGKAYLTVDSINGDAQAILRLKNIDASTVSLYRINNMSNMNSNKLLFQLEPQQDYWQLPADSVFTRSDLVDFGKQQLLFIVTSPDYASGEVAGWL